MDQAIVRSRPARMDRLFQSIEHEVRCCQGVDLPFHDQAGLSAENYMVRDVRNDHPRVIFLLTLNRALKR